MLGDGPVLEGNKLVVYSKYQATVVRVFCLITYNSNNTPKVQQCLKNNKQKE